MLMILQRYYLEAEFVKGKDNVVVNTLSRVPLETDSKTEETSKQGDIFEIQIRKEIEEVEIEKPLKISEERLQEIRTVTETDQTLHTIKKYITEAWPQYIADVDEICNIFHKNKHELATQRGIVFKREKVDVAHTGTESTLKLARETIFLARYDNINHAIHTKMRNLYEIRRVATTTTNAVTRNTSISFSTCLFSRHEIPMRVNGTNFENKVIHDLSRTWGFEFVTSAPKHSRGNSKAVSRKNRRLVRKAEENNEGVWYSLLH